MRTTLLAVLIALAACGGDKEEQSASDKQELPPEATVEAIFAAAKSDNAAALARLCDPTGDNDADTQTICDIKPGTEWDDFKKLFAIGKITGAAVVDGDHATVPFQFGPARGYKENMQLIRRDGTWYLWKL